MIIGEKKEIDWKNCKNGMVEHIRNETPQGRGLVTPGEQEGK